MGVQGYEGRRLRIEMDPGERPRDAPKDWPGTGTIAEVVLGVTLRSHLGRTSLADLVRVRLDVAVQTGSGDAVRDVLIGGHGMDLLTELYGTPQRPKGLPILVGLWRLTDEMTLNWMISHEKIPPSAVTTNVV